MADWDGLSRQLKKLERSLEEYEMRQDIFNRKILDLERKKEKLLHSMTSDNENPNNALAQMEVREAVIQLEDECLRVKSLMNNFGVQIEDLLANADKFKAFQDENNGQKSSGSSAPLDGIFSLLGSPLVRQLALDMIGGFLKGKGEMKNA